MTPDNASFMWIAYGLVAALHLGYALTLWRRHARVREQLDRATRVQATREQATREQATRER